METQDRLTTVFAALADPTRRAILARLAAGEASVAELTRPFNLSQPTISKHLRVLESAGLIEQGREAQKRPRRLVLGGPLRTADEWMRPFREQWEQRFDRLETHLATRASRLSKPAK